MKYNEYFKKMVLPYVKDDDELQGTAYIWGEAAWNRAMLESTRDPHKLWLANTETLKGKISKILGDALAGIEQRYRHDRNYIRWGLVEKEIFDAIDAAQIGGNEKS